ncbi:unnamed protein product [Caenorhabditis bovis]|uniref:EGF-like domain-containing protein n=1 Tax=Caenorhabditis bovis TaxID=2654633 RepID=A0A8S1F8P7_9PELO|nr:unnamed protein product [Caenorhabditis bovis]
MHLKAIFLTSILYSIYYVNGKVIRKFIDLLDKDAPTPLKLAPNYNEESISYKRNKKFDPCVQNPKICGSNGKCLSKDGNFYCICAPTHYGKTCEHIADQTNCQSNICENNSTCVSSETHRTIMNTTLIQLLRASKPDFEPLSISELASAEIVINYECICQPGFVGEICEISEAQRSCEEDYCLNRGRGVLEENKCVCKCEKQFFGNRCEQVSACYETKCENGGVCEDEIDMKAKTISAKCVCPKKIKNVDAVIEGEFCEKVKIIGENKNLPCAPGGNAFEMMSAMMEKLPNLLETEAETKELREIQNNYNDGTNKPKKMTNGWCENGGKCVPQVVKIASKEFYYLPTCTCTDPLTEGYYCEYKRKDACDLTLEEIARGVRLDEKCTDIAHGACVDILGTAHCVCKPDYTGANCENFDPCARKPCKHGNCIALSESSSPGGARYQCLCPLSAKLEHGTDCVNIEEGVCKKGICGHGRCMPCDAPKDDDMLPICNQAEIKRGYRCLCEAGFVPPFCRAHSNPCYQNLCQNSAKCVPNQYKSYDCQCLNGTSGTICENIDDACEAFGHSVCQNGECINDYYWRRGFSCDCLVGYEGLNCEISLPLMATGWRLVTRHYQFTMPVAFCALSLILLFIFSTRTANRQKEL